MPRPKPPARRKKPLTPEPFRLADAARSAIANVLGLPELGPVMLNFIEMSIARCKAQSKFSTVSKGENIAAIEEALNHANKLEKSLLRFTDEHGSVGEKTLHRLNPSAIAVLVALNKFRDNAKARRKELKSIKLFNVADGPLGPLCAVLKLSFETVQLAKGLNPNEKGKLRNFTRAVLEAAGTPCEDYYEHPRRMDKLFRLPVSDDSQTQQFVKDLILEIQTMAAI
jgi:hypothetical protein